MTTLRRMLLATAAGESADGKEKAGPLTKQEVESAIGASESSKKRELGDKESKQDKKRGRKDEDRPMKKEEGVDGSLVTDDDSGGKLDKLQRKRSREENVIQAEQVALEGDAKAPAKESPQSTGDAVDPQKQKQDQDKDQEQQQQQQQQLQQEQLQQQHLQLQQQLQHHHQQQQQLQAARQHQQPQQEEEVEDKLVWVQCEKCHKWRDIAPGSSLDDLPKHWYCSMNTWDPKYASCDVPQKETQEEEVSAVGSEEAEKSRNKKRKKPNYSEDPYGAILGTPQSGRGGAGNANANRRKSAKNAAGKRGDQAGVNQGPKQGNLRPSISNMMSNNAMNSRGNAKDRKNWNWVMCETCQQWRRLPPEVDVDGLPEKWYCHMNKWDKQRATCSAPQEADDTTAEQDPAQTGTSDGRNQIVRLPEGVNLYGGSLIPVKGRKHVPMNYRELIVNHYRHFNKYDQTANTFLNFRYYESSLFVPRGMKNKGKKSAFEKGLVPARSTNVSASARIHKGVSNAAIVKQSTFAKLIGLAPPPPPTNHSTKASPKSAVPPFPNMDTAATGTTVTVDGTVVETNQKSSSSTTTTPATTEPFTSLQQGDGVVSEQETDVDAREFVKPDSHFTYPPGLIQRSKPWKRAGGWMNLPQLYQHIQQ